MISNVKNNTRNRIYYSESDVTNALSKNNSIFKLEEEDDLIKGNITLDDAIKQKILGEKQRTKVYYFAKNSDNEYAEFKSNINYYIKEIKDNVNKFEKMCNELKGNKIDRGFISIEPRNESEYNEECFKIAIQDMMYVSRVMFNMINIASKYFYTLANQYISICMKAAVNGYEYIYIYYYPANITL